MGDLNCHVGSEAMQGIYTWQFWSRSKESGRRDAHRLLSEKQSYSYEHIQESHQCTWYRYNSQVGKYDQKSESDFILTNRKAIIKDVQAMALVSLDSDHRLVRDKLKLHLPKAKKKVIRGAVVAEWLRPLTSMPEVPGSNPGPAVAPLGKALYPHCLVFRRRL